MALRRFKANGKWVSFKTKGKKSKGRGSKRRRSTQGSVPMSQGEADRRLTAYARKLQREKPHLEGRVILLMMIDDPDAFRATRVTRRQMDDWQGRTILANKGNPGFDWPSSRMPRG